MIRNIVDLAKFHCVDNADEQTVDSLKSKIERNVYKYTDCGASVTFYDDGVKYGSIVEGWDDGYINGNKLTYPFDDSEIDDELEIINRRASMCWNEINNPDGDDVDWDVVCDLSVNG